MKHIKLFFSVASLAIATLVSCQKEIESGEKPSNENVVILKGFVDDNINNLTKTSLVDGVDIQWASTDAISAFDYDFELQHSISVELSNSGKTANFTMPAAEAYFYAIYPKDENASINTDSEVITTTLPTSQKAVANSFGPGANIALADASNGTEGMQFYNGGALVSVKVNNDNIKKIVLSGSGEYAYMSGPCTMNFYGTGAEKTVVCQSTYEEQINEVVMRGDFVNGSTYYFVVLPGNYETPRLKITNDYGQTVTLKNSATIEVNSNDNYFIADLPDLSSSLAAKPCKAEFDFTDLDFLGIQASDFESSAYAVTGKTFSDAHVTISFTQADGKAANRIWSSNSGYDLRLYEDATLTFTAPDGFVIDRITLTGAAVGGFKNYTSVEYNYDNSTKTGVWSGEESFVSFTIPSGGSKISTALVEFSRIDPTKPSLLLNTDYASGNWDDVEYNFTVTSKNIDDLVIAPDSSDDSFVSVTSTADPEDETKTNVAVVLKKSFNEEAETTHVVYITSETHSELNKTFTITQGKAPAKGMTLKVGTDAAVDGNVTMVLASDAGSSKDVVVTTNYNIYTPVVSDNNKIGVTNSGSTYTISAISANSTEGQLSLGTVTFTDESGSSHVVTVKQNPAAGKAGVGDTLWSENFTGANPTYTRTSPNYCKISEYGKEGTSVYGDATITYTGNADANVKVYTNSTASAGTVPELGISSNNTWTVSGIPTGDALQMNLEFKTNKEITVSTSTIGITLGTKSYANKVYSVNISNTGAVKTFDLNFTHNANCRIDDISLTVTQANDGKKSINIDESIVGGTITANPARQTPGQSVTLSNEPSTGYEFVSYVVKDASQNNVDLTGSTFTMPNSDVSVTGTFTKVNYTLTDASGDNGSLTFSKATANYQDEVTINVVPSTGYRMTAGTLKAYKTGDESTIVPISGTTISMPAYNVTVTCAFEDASSKGTLDKPVISAASGSTTTISGSWSAVEHATGYNWYVSTSSTWGSASDASVMANGSVGRVTSLADVALGTTLSVGDYYLYIQAVDNTENYNNSSMSTGYKYTISSGPKANDELYAADFGDTAMALNKYTGHTTYNSASTISYSVSNSNVKIDAGSANYMTNANLFFNGKDKAAGYNCTISGIKVYGATKVKVTWASNATSIKVKVNESSSEAATSTKSATNSAEFTLLSNTSTISLTITNSTKSNARLDDLKVIFVE